MPQDKTGSGAGPLVYTDEAVEDNARFWAIIEGAGRDRDALDAALRQLDADELVAFGALVRDAGAAVREPWQGPWVPSDHFDAGGFHLSEDSTEDFTDWIVSLGRAAWLPLVGADDAALQEVYAIYNTLRDDLAHPMRWSGPSGKVFLSGLVYNIYTDRFGDDFHDALSALYDEVW